ncbi:MAG: hypothetical protein ACLFPM_01110 [Candidatus Izemoplasmatales bacterium]
MLHSDFKDNLIRIHLLYHAKANNGIQADPMAKEIESHGYQTTPSQIKKELEHLKKEEFLNFRDGMYYISDRGHKELLEAQVKVKILHQEINQEE